MDAIQTDVKILRMLSYSLRGRSLWSAGLGSRSIHQIAHLKVRHIRSVISVISLDTASHVRNHIRAARVDGWGGIIGDWSSDTRKTNSNILDWNGGDCA